MLLCAAYHFVLRCVITNDLNYCMGCFLKLNFMLLLFGILAQDLSHSKGVPKLRVESLKQLDSFTYSSLNVLI